MNRRFFLGAATAASALSVSGANDRINIGLIGTGGRGMDHVNDLIKLKDLNLAVTSVCDVYRPNRERGAAATARGLGVTPHTTTDYRELLARKDVDAVIIATPDFGHPIILKAAVEAGKDAYVEKVDAELIGGVSIRIGDELYDGSVSRRLSDLRREFSKNPYIPSI